jgi:ribA/ribD-fused uncharacterized protein
MKVGIIDKFEKKNFFLSNFYPCDIVYKGQKFTSTEAAFQCQKCANEEDKINFSHFEPSQSKMYGRKVKLRKDWEDVKIQEMENILRAKFTQIPALGERLVKTGNAILIEGNTWRDTFWGVYEGKGENNLGKLLMKIREELRNESN